MDVLYPRCAGLDVHKKTVVAAVRLAAGGEVVRAVHTFATTTAGLLELSAWLSDQGCTPVAMEATGVYWKPVWHILADGSFTLILANAAHVKNVPGRKTDVADAAWLAELLAHGLIRASFVPDEPTQELRALLRTRKQLVRERSGHVQRLQKTLEDANIKLDSVISDVLGVSGRALIEALIADESDPAALAALAQRGLKAPPERLCEALRRPPAPRRPTCKRSSIACAADAAPRRRSAPWPPRSSRPSITCSATAPSTTTSAPTTSTGVPKRPSPNGSPSGSPASASP